MWNIMSSSVLISEHTQEVKQIQDEPDKIDLSLFFSCLFKDDTTFTSS